MKFEIKLTGIKLFITICFIILSWTVMGIIIIHQSKNDPDLLIHRLKIYFNKKEKMIIGPWGDLEVIPFTLQPPVGMVSGYHSLLEVSKNWRFENASLEDVRELFLKVGLSPKICDSLINFTKPIPNGNGYITSPPDSIFLNFSPEIKAKLYPLIGKFNDNPTYTYPLSYPSTNPNDWFLASNLRQSLVKQIIPLIYIRNNICCISDLHLIAPYLKTPLEKNILMQTLFRTQALEIFLKIKEGQDISKLAEYWSNLGNIEEITPLLESIRRIDGGGKIDIVNLLPPIPRSRLNSFVTADEYYQHLRDCHWATFNFFNDQSDERVGKMENLNRLLHAETIPLPKGQKPKFGDIILILDKEQHVLHSCVYIVDNIVFTKDGSAPDRPFKLAYLKNVLSLYSINGGLKTIYFSRKIKDTHQIKL